MRVGLLIYGSLDILTGGFLYDRLLVDYLRREGDEVEVISLPWRTYGRHLSDNVSAAFFRRLCRASCDVLIQDELNHPSVWWLNRRLKPRVSYPLVSIVHLLRSSEARPAWQNRFYRWVEQRYLQTLDGLIFNSKTTGRQVEAQRPYCRARCNDAFPERRRGPTEPAAVSDGVDARDSGLAMLVAHGNQVTAPLVMVVPATQAPEHLVVRLKAVADTDRINLNRAVCRTVLFTNPDERRRKPAVGGLHCLQHPPPEHRYTGSAEAGKITQSVQDQARR